MLSFRASPISRKLILISMVSTALALVLASAALIIYDIIETKQSIREELSILTTVIGDSSSAALIFYDKERAGDNLATLKARHSIVSACLYTNDGHVFASYSRGHTNESACQPLTLDNINRTEDVIQFSDSKIHQTDIFLSQPIFLDGELIGAISVLFDTSDLQNRINKYIAIVAIIFLIAVCAAFFLSSRLQRFISEPISQLGKTAKHISEYSDYSVRAVKHNDDELGLLVDAFNNMLETIEEKNVAVVATKERYRIMYDDNPAMLFTIDIDGKVLSINQFGAEQLGYTVDELIGQSLLDVVSEEDTEIVLANVKTGLSQSDEIHNWQSRLLHKNGPILWVNNKARTITGNNGLPAMLIMCENITERKHATTLLAFEKKCLEMIAQNHSRDDILNSITRDIDEIVPGAFSSILLLDSSGKHLKHGAAPSLPKEYVEAVDGIEIGPKVGSCGTAAYFNKQVFVSDIANDALWEDYRDIALKYGLMACWSTPITVAGGKVLGTFALYFSSHKELDTKIIDLMNCMANIVAITVLRKQTEEKLTYQASHDALTGLVNRREFERRAEQLLSTVRQDQSEHALCFMDLDQFKVVNDTCGHTAGDELLRQLSSVLKRTVRHSDTLARLGGDEFSVLMEDCSLDDAHRVATSLQKAIQNYQFSWDGHSFHVGVSIGLVPITEGTPNLTELLKDADAACYVAKDAGRNRIHVHHAEDSELSQRHGEMQWVTRLHKALEEDRFCLYAQTIEPLDGRTDKHYELLLRMIDEEGGIIPPGAFLPAAERYNLMSKIDRWVIESAFALLADNPAFLSQINFISINLSGQSLTDPEILEFIIVQLDESEIQGSKICFEITETAAISNLSKAIKFISTLKELGCRFALDDFGSGLSSFAYLKNLPVDYLKIDGMFVKDIVDDPIDRAMVRSINDIGHVMGMKTIAEFVESDGIKDMLKKIGVDYAQGYGIGKPELFEKLLRSTSNATDINNTKRVGILS